MALRECEKCHEKGMTIATRQTMKICPHRSFRAVFTLAVALLLGVTLTPARLFAQTATTGALSGVVADSSGAVVPGATVTVRDTATGATLTVTTNAEGRFSALLLKPSTYEISAQYTGLASGKTSVAVTVGQTVTSDLKVTPSGENTTVTVSAQAAQLTDTQSPALVTTFTEQQIQNLPAPGGDITTVAFTAPGVAVNAGGSYGNFSADGLPGTSNLYVMNGFDDEDPFLNLNNSGSSNLSLGQGEIDEASVVLNGYSAQYGRAAGAILNYTTKSGTNKFHGMLNYFYNGDVLNANDWFRNYSGEGRQRAISNEWAANVGGPIIKDKLFFFADYEGLRYVLPDTGYAVFPSTQFQNYMLANVPSDALPLYEQAFALYNASPSHASAVAVTTGSGPLQDSTGSLGCGGFAGTAGATAAGLGTQYSCETAAVGSASATNKEWLFTARVDWNISDRQKLFGRFKMDRGTQPTYTSFVSPAFNTISSQPSYEGQLNDTIVFNPHLTNQFIFAANWYTAYFGPSDLSQTLSTFPTYWGFYDGAINGNGTAFGSLGAPYYFPQGRNVSQYQFVDDLSWTKGSHTFRFGYNFRRDDISDYDAQELENGFYEFLSLDNLANGQLATSDGSQSYYLQNFAKQSTAYLALYNIGAYLQDEWQATSRLHTTVGIRFDRTGNPLCNNNCFARYNGTFPDATTDDPYNQAISANLADAFPSVEAVVVQPRFGFNYDVTGNGRTVIRGGIGLFGDLPAATYLDSFVQNFPQLYSATVTSGEIAPATSVNSAPYFAAQSNSLLQSGFSSGQTATQISNSLGAIGVPFTAPNLTISQQQWRSPKYLEWNLQVQHQIGRYDAIIIGYVGNEGYDELIQNPFVNASSSTPFGNLPTTSPDTRFGAVNAFLNEANSNYNGGSITYKHIDRGLTVDVTYNYSHALDDVSNGGAGEYYNATAVNQMASPSSIAALNYSNADYDYRHNLTADYVYQMPYLKGHSAWVNSVAGGWLFSGKTYWRTGSPFSIVDSSLYQSTFGGSAQILAAAVPGAKLKYHCNGNGITTPCLSDSEFETSDTQTTFGNVRRNAFYGPHYADSDWTLSKKFVNLERFTVQIGASAFNVFNHPNFGQPSNDVGAGSIGSSGNIVAPPTSPYGSFQSAGVGGRVLQVFGKVNF
ncbi:carboxypeptidase regulatory-like domain-containing protein [Silvibacterium sp.]|uniref:TonB-dependent receptor n=1 Tax=Silvibacterium sp. TaxID=1964179 RepID=UPI0039E4D922